MKLGWILTGDLVIPCDTMWYRRPAFFSSCCTEKGLQKKWEQTSFVYDFRFVKSCTIAVTNGGNLSQRIDILLVPIHLCLVLQVDNSSAVWNPFLLQSYPCPLCIRAPCTFGEQLAKQVWYPKPQALAKHSTVSCSHDACYGAGQWMQMVSCNDLRPRSAKHHVHSVEPQICRQKKESKSGTDQVGSQTGTATTKAWIETRLFSLLW